MATPQASLVEKIGSLQNLKEFAELHWSGTFEQYLDIIRANPSVGRSAFKRVYDMVLSYGQEEYIDNKKRLVRYNFFKDEQHGGRDAIFGLDIPLMRLVNVLKSAAERYGTERRVILLHGPVGSSKSTIARLLKRGMEEYSRTADGALYTYDWILPKELQQVSGGHETFKCPMHEEPLRLIPPEWREKALIELGINTPDHRKVQVDGDLDPACRLVFRELLTHYKGDWAKVVSHVRVRRLLLSEQDRVGIGTFQPKDEKNQDSHRADRRHQLPEDRRVRIGQRPAGVQLRRRVQHRQPGHHRVHRGAEAGRGVPLRPAGRLAGTQDQAEEVRPDGHRRGDPRPHQRGRIQEAAVQRVHGGAAGPDGEDRHPVHHPHLRGTEDLREGLQRRQGSREAHRPAHPGDGGACGRCSRAWRIPRSTS